MMTLYVAQQIVDLGKSKSGLSPQINLEVWVWRWLDDHSEERTAKELQDVPLGQIKNC